MDLQALFHWLYILGMAVGAIYFISLSTNPRGVPKYEYLVAAFIPIWSGLAYLSMNLPHGELEQGKIAVAGQITHFARYIDWVVTTPLLLLALSWTGMHRLQKKDWTLIAALMMTQVIVVVCGLVADLSVIPWVRYLWYFNGVVAFLVVLWGIWGPLRAKTRSQGAELSNFYDRLTTYFTVLWICYPIVWILGPSGFRVFNQTVDTFLFCLIPFFSKVGFSFLDLHGLRNISSGATESATDRTVGNIMQFFLGTPKRRRLSMQRRSFY
ncbi:bacteriorhodopsin [Gloeocapsa sp. BRSZ]|uniref:bacteriorhodopsin n=1 Tax=Gloeocapsa sp. PCC 7428 TaxID=1173026 RepID=UPI0002A5F1B5|nr:bacteriorhodopsin [Gloeocapsa sp. PCC 7428]AFZ32418.1 rhodopsin [Gloeocapsa sp. PCC 7428]